MKERDIAVALGYNPEADTAPKVLAAGYGEVARRILAIAKKEGLHIHQDDNLARLLARVPTGSEIPEAAYQLVAELLTFLSIADQHMAEKPAGPNRKFFPDKL